MLRVLSISQAGIGYELSERISGLQWSNVKNGGDEQASFAFHAPWQAASPEVAEGNKLVVFDGLDVLWQGRIDEADRAGSDEETLEVTAYGLGKLLKDQTYSMIFVDRSIDPWREPGVQRQINLRLANTPAVGSAGGLEDTTNGPGLQLSVSGAWVSPQVPTAETWDDAGEDLGFSEIYAEVEGPADTAFQLFVSGSNDDVLSSAETTADLFTAATVTISQVFSAARRYIALTFGYNATPAGVAGAEYAVALRKLATFGTHGLTKQGSSPGGFLASQIIEYVVGLVAGIQTRRVDSTAIVLEQAVHRDLTHEAGVSDVHRFHSHERTWGTWGPASPLEALGVGQFDYTALERSTQHWFAMRSDCDDVSLQSARAELFNVCKVNYTDETGASRTLTRTRFVAELGADTQTKTIAGGKLTTAAATALGDAALALFGGFAPARGSAQITGPITHYRRGELPPHFARADGANIRVPDVLPSTTLFELTDDPDRRTTFPVSRVQVDASGDVPQATLELDQGQDVLDALLARTEAAAELVGA